MKHSALLESEMGLIKTKTIFLLSFILLSYILIMLSGNCAANDTLSKSLQLSVGQTLISAGQIFEVGFFSLGNPGKQYVGMWYKNVSIRRYVWVANRDNPLMINDTASSLKIGAGGNLILLDGNQTTVWLTEVSVKSNNTIAVLLDSGNLVLKDNISGLILWESFNNPTDTMLPTMLVGMNTKTGEKRFLSSWQAEDDPSSGKFVAGLSSDAPPQGFIWINGSSPYWRSGPWNGWKFIGIQDAAEGYAYGMNVVQDNQQGSVHLMFNNVHSPSPFIMIVTPEGSLRYMLWEEELNDWTVTWVAQESPCDVYGTCGPFGVCNKKASPICECLKGFVPRSNQEWNRGIWSNGCVRRTELQCGKNSSGLASRGAEIDGFLKLRAMKFPDHFKYLNIEEAPGCRQWCMNNCSCLAYAYPAGMRCMVWTETLLDINHFSSSGEDIIIRLAHLELGEGKSNKKLIIISTTVSCLILFSIFGYGMWKWKVNHRVRRRKRIAYFGRRDKTYKTKEASLENVWDHLMQSEQSELPMMDFNKIVVSTKNFSNMNKLGEGGFGPVYKGKLEDGREIAVKRLSNHSGQGVEEFKNEIILISKLQHRNLVRLLGFCIGREERLLIYEYMENKSLDTFLFDPKKSLCLDWSKRFDIIQGIARGLLYLHRDSRLRIIHRDLKASNILLEDDLNPKISDFGLARIFQLKQELANTQRVVGTFGYMSPEYAMGGIFSEKSDVFSFGVLLLEIVSSRKNTSFRYHEEYLNLVCYAWKLWNENKGLELIDEKLVASCSPSQVLRCIQIGLLCVQDHASDRPTMSDIVFMLSHEATLSQPHQSTFTFDSHHHHQGNNIAYSINKTTMSMTQGR